MESFDIIGTALGNILTATAAAAATWAGTFFFYRQRKKSMEIDNESKQSEEWRKLYLDSQQDSERKDQKIDELRREIAELRNSLISLERRVQLNSIYRCELIQCANRIPPMHTHDHMPSSIPPVPTPPPPSDPHGFDVNDTYRPHQRYNEPRQELYHHESLDHKPPFIPMPPGIDNPDA